MKAQHLDALFSPASIAIVGASNRASSWTREIQGNLERFGPAGASL